MIGKEVSIYMKKTVLRSYAKLIARAGVNIEKGQKVAFPDCRARLRQG